jgi:hypothetical protein
MTDTDFGRLRISKANGVATVTIDNPPVNVLDVPLMGEIRRLLLSLRDDPNTRVLVFQSADPEFFIAHVDMTLIDEPHAFDELARDATSAGVTAGIDLAPALVEEDLGRAMTLAVARFMVVSSNVPTDRRSSAPLWPCKPQTTSSARSMTGSTSISVTIFRCRPWPVRRA